MKSDIDRLMQELSLDAILVLGDESPNMQRQYLGNGTKVKANGIVVKKRGEKPVIIVSGMELDEAAKSGMTVMSWYDFGWVEAVRKHRGDGIAVTREVYTNVMTKLGVKGRIALYGTVSLDDMIHKIQFLQDNSLGIEVVTSNEVSQLFQRAYETKSPEEIVALKESAERTCQVVQRTWDFISSHRAEGSAVGSRVVDKAGNPLTIGAVKHFIKMQEFDLGLSDEEGCIFSIGRDSALPHSVGNDSDVLQVGKTIVFDIFPIGEKSGYYHDMTRTWCIGQAPPEVQEVYNDVKAVFDKVMSALKVGADTSVYQQMALDYFESKGHPTQRSKPGTYEGYVHSLGHGIGLNVHEAPQFREHSTNTKLTPGNVVTVEPGLYYPDRGFGVRVEDSVYFDEAGTLHKLTNFPYDLVLPLKG